ncbi:DUF551 domain-containing protein [Yersinia intermedia]|uniref:DUF551 domain-containing protein n=1 Tax=Yersinia intermedia TaxID=631 RepID=UPI0022FE1B77|nr:DUF551 domain-containing protein [Yersinia intermedia]MDA5482875.1 DUF551 domain-containing protein [Yersinia intermedia]
MKELDSFTVERLEEIRNSFLDRIQESAPSLEEVFALIDIALAAKRAEPFGYIDSVHTDNWNYINLKDETSTVAFISRTPDGIVRKGCAMPIYTTPLLNSQVQLGSWIKCSDQIPEDDTLCLGVDECGVIWTMHFDDGEFRADTGDVDDLKISHWMPLPAAPEKP